MSAASLELNPALADVLGHTPTFAEIKTQSPFDPHLARDWDEQFSIAERIGDIISVHADARWGGSLALIDRARQLTTKPILAKGYHPTEAYVHDALDAGADLVLSVGTSLLSSDLIDLCLIEPRNVRELQRIPPSVKVVWNSRDLRDGALKKEPFALARSLFPGWLCQASNISHLSDIEPTADALLIGTHVSDIEQELKTLERSTFEHPLSLV